MKEAKVMKIGDTVRFTSQGFRLRGTIESAYMGYADPVEVTNPGAMVDTAVRLIVAPNGKMKGLHPFYLHPSECKVVGQ